MGTEAEYHLICDEQSRDDCMQSFPDTPGGGYIDTKYLYIAARTNGWKEVPDTNDDWVCPVCLDDMREYPL